MSQIAIQFDHVGKIYRLGTVGTHSLVNDLNRWWHTKILHHEDPLLKIGQRNDRTKKGESDAVWALKDITFDVNKGDIVGIIGRNGAGKSTLLKLLSRVTAPTTGTIRARGRIASLLEVGTGFHPELTGRENIYLNGTIMGMTRREIAGKFDDIVDFAGVARYIDTPTKRYSSGMMVRLGFAVAAFLEPEILIVDEVLAVGDAEFQKRSVGKIQDVSQHSGRTVLFVSHNMSTVNSLCKSGIVLDKGSIVYSGTSEEAIRQYRLLAQPTDDTTKITDKIIFLKAGLDIQSITINGSENSSFIIEPNQTNLELEITGHTPDPLITDLILVIKTQDGIPLATLAEGYYKGLILKIPPGEFKISKQIKLPQFLARGTYNIDIHLYHPMTEWHMKAPSCAQMEAMGNQIFTGQPLELKYHGIMGLETLNSDSRNGLNGKVKS